MSIQDFSKRYVYIIDEDRYYDRQRRVYFDEVQLAGKIKHILGANFNFQKAAEMQDLLKDFGIDSSELRIPRMSKKETKTRSLDAAYEAIKDSINLVRHFDGHVLTLYSVSSTLEVAYLGTCKEELFEEYVQSRLETATKFKEAFQDPEYGAQIRSFCDFHAFVLEQYKRFKSDPDKLLGAAPSLLAWDSGPAFRVLNSEDLKPGATPTWDEFLARMDYPDIFRAYVWSIFEPANFGRQALWIQGEGGDGKSTVLRALASYMGTQHTLTIGIGSYDKDFFFGEAFGKRLAIYPDCKNLQVLRKERIKQLLGRDIVPINNKYEKVFSAQIYAKLLVASNWLPQINYNDDSERTRLLLVRVKSFQDEMGDPDFQYNLEAEIGSFLVQCKAAYAQLCPNGMSLRVPRGMAAEIKSSCSALDSDLLEEFIEGFLEFGPGFKVAKTQLHYQLKMFFSNYYASQSSHFSFNDLMRLLSKRGVPSSTENGVNTFIGVRIKPDSVRLKGSHTSGA